MTAPTQAQIEAALRDLVERLDFVHDDRAYKSVWAVNQLHVGPYSGPTYEKELEKAKAVLTAAAEAGENEIEKLRRQRIEFDCRYTMGKVADLTGNHCPIDKPCLRCQNERLEAATIERCAQVAERTPCLGYGKEPGEVIAAAIRALKDQP